MSRSVLIVDDEEDVRAIARLGIELSTDWSVLTAKSGQEALDRAAALKPDVILLDLMMPNMDGRATLQNLKANPATQAIPVILLTAKAAQAEQIGFSELDIAAIFPKPFRPLELTQQIRQVLGWWR